MNGILNVEMALTNVDVILELNVVMNGINVVVLTGLVLHVVNLVLIVLNKIHGIHNVYHQPQIHLLVVVKNGTNAGVKNGKVEDVVNQENVLNKMNIILNV